jgi:hypothetical protein
VFLRLGADGRWYRRAVARALAIATVLFAACDRSPATSRDGSADASTTIDAATIDAPTPNLSWTWTFGGSPTCPTGVDRVLIYTAEWNEDSIDFRNPPDPPTTFPCSAGGGGVVVADGFDYDSWLEILTSDDRVFAVTGATHVDQGSTATTDVALPRGYVYVAWSLFGMHSQTTLACTDVPSLTGSGGGAIELFAGSGVQSTPLDVEPCSMGGTYFALPPGGYDLTLRAVYSQEYFPASGFDAYTIGSTTFPGQTITANGTLDLGTQQLTLTTY